MSKEGTLEHHSPLSSTPEQEQEMSLATSLRHLVDDLFTDEVIAQRLENLSGNDEALENLVENWKQGLTQHLVDSAQAGGHNIVATLDLFQANPGAPALSTEPYEWQQLEAWHKSFSISYVCREDLRGILPDEQIADLTDEQMGQIAAKMSDVFQDNGGYWESLVEIVGKVSGEQIPVEQQIPQANGK